MNSKAKWFVIFGDGAPWIQATLNIVLGAMFAAGVVVFILRFVSTSIKAKMSEDIETKSVIRKENLKNIVALGGLLALATIVFIVVNILPAPSKPNTNTFFQVFKSASADAQKYFNLIIALMISSAIILYLVITATRLIKFMNAGDEDKMKIRTNIMSSTWWLMGIVVALFIFNVVLNIVPKPTFI